MEDLSNFVWLGIVIIWFLSRFIRRAAKKAARKQTTPRPTVSRPTTTPSQSAGPPFAQRPGFSGRGDKGPPPIVPR